MEDKVLEIKDKMSDIVMASDVTDIRLTQAGYYGDAQVADAGALRKSVQIWMLWWTIKVQLGKMIFSIYCTRRDLYISTA